MSAKKSKIFLSTLAATFFTIQNSFAGEIYFAPSLLLTQSEAEYSQGSSRYNVVSESSASQTGAGFGAEVGYRASIGGFFIGPEIYYSYYNTNINKFTNSAHPELSGQDVIRIKDDVGLALNLGYKFSKLAVFGKFGIGGARSDISWYNKDGDGMDQASEEFSMSTLASIGLSYDINDFIAFRISYDTKYIDIERDVPILSDVLNQNQPSFGVTIQAINTGLIFKF